MNIGLVVLYVVTLLCLVVVSGIHPQLSFHSTFELRRRARRGDTEAVRVLKRHELLHDVFSLQRVLTAILLVALSIIGVELFHWVAGLIISLVIALEYGAVARLPLLQRHSQGLYEKYEMKILTVIERYPRIFRAIRSVSPMSTDGCDIESKEELIAMVKRSGAALEGHERRLVVNALSFDTKTVATAMTPKSMIEAVHHDEVLGPLVLNELHKSGYSRFPVIKGDIDHVIGILHVHTLLSISRSQKTRHAESAMEKRVYYIREDQTLQQALAAFLRTNHHLFIVINQYRETVGLLSLEDVIEALLGRKINDEFDAHEDLRKVAERNPRGNNISSAGRNV